MISDVQLGWYVQLGGFAIMALIVYYFIVISQIERAETDRPQPASASKAARTTPAASKSARKKRA